MGGREIDMDIQESSDDFSVRESLLPHLDDDITEEEIAWYEADGLEDIRPVVEDSIDEPGWFERVWARIRRRPDGYLEKKKLYEAAKEQWWELHREETEPETPDDLPGYDLEIDGTTYHVRGVVHGGRRFLQSSKEQKRFTAEKILEYAENGNRVLVEEGVPKRMGFDDLEEEYGNVREMEDVSWAFKEDGWGMIKVGALLPLHAVISGVTTYLSSFSDDENHDLETIQTAKEACKDVDELGNAQNLVESFLLPYDLEEDFRGEYHPVKNLIMQERSAYQAAHAVMDARRRDADSIHLVSGFGHTPHLREKIPEYEAEGLPPEYAFQSIARQLMENT